MKYITTYEQNNGIIFKEWLKVNPQDINTTEIDCSYSNLIDFLIYWIILNTYIVKNNKLPYNNLNEYIEWYKKEYPWKWDSKKYNL